LQLGPPAAPIIDYKRCKVFRGLESRVSVPFEHSVRTIALLGGTGNLGRGLATRFSSRYHVIIGSRFRKKAEAATEEVRQLVGRARSKRIVGMLNREAAQKAELVVFCVKLEPALRLAARLKPKLKDKLILSPVAPKRRKGKFYVPRLGPHTSAALRLARVLGQRSRVVAGFHTIPAPILYSTKPLPDYSVVIYGEEPAKGTVMQMTNEMRGLQALDGGPLELSFLSEYATPLLMNLKRLNKCGSCSVRYF